MEDGECEDRQVVCDKFRALIFQQDNIQNPDLDLSQPEQSEHFFIENPCGKIGAWFLQPEDDQGADNNNVLLYLHGVKGTRAREHRVQLYKVLLAEGFRILTIDYRGFGDSSDTSEAEKSMVEDARSALGWLRESGRLGASDRLIVWGHSMGTGVATRAVAEEFKDSASVSGLILEAPYNNFTDEMAHISTNTSWGVANAAMATIHSTTGLLSKTLAYFDMQFQSDSWIQDIPCPIMILHAMGDTKIPISLGRKLYDAAVASGHENVQFHEFDDSYSHRESLSDNNSRYMQLADRHKIFSFCQIFICYR